MNEQLTGGSIGEGKTKVFVNVTSKMLDQWKKSLQNALITLFESEYKDIFFNKNNDKTKDVNTFRNFLDYYEHFQTEITNNNIQSVEFCV